MSDAVMVPRCNFTVDDLLDEAQRRVIEGDLGAPGGKVGTLGDLTAAGLILSMRDVIRALAASTPVGGWEPVAWRWRYKGTNWVYGNDLPVWASSDDCDEVIEPLYAAPPPPSFSIDNGSRPQEAVPTCEVIGGRLEPGDLFWGVLRASHIAINAVAVLRADPSKTDLVIGALDQLAKDLDEVVNGDPTPQPADGCSSNEGAGDDWIEERQSAYRILPQTEKGS